VHAAFTCSDDTLERAAALAAEFGTGVHVHVAEGSVDADAATRLDGFTTEAWLLAHCVHLADDAPLLGTIAHNPRSNTGNGVGYARPARFAPAHRVVLGTDGIDGDMHAERDAAAALATPDLAAGWLDAGRALVPEVAHDRVTWAADGHRAVEVVVDGEVVLRDGRPTRVDADEIRAMAREAAARVQARMD
jgi:cytosine/adenosine deaminase-related metal-dependent hydrolase